MKNILIAFAISVCFICCNSTNPHIEKVEKLYSQGQFKEALKYIDLHNSEIYAYQKTELKRRITDTLTKIALQEIKDGEPVAEIYLGFQFGMSENEYDNYAEKLISENKLKPQRTITYSVGWGEYIRKLHSSGYDQEFHVKDYMCTAILKPQYFGGELVSLEVCLYNIGDKEKMPTISDIKEMYDRKYEAPEMSSVLDLYYAKDSQEYIQYYWRDANLAILLYEIGGYIIINYVDLNAKELINDIKQLQQEAEIESNKNKAIDQLNNI